MKGALPLTVLWLMPTLLLNGQTTINTDRGENLQAFEASIAKQRDAISRQMVHHNPQDVSARFLRIIEASVEKQRASVDKQLNAVKPNVAVLSVAWPPQIGAASLLPDPECWRVRPSEIEDYVQEVATREGLSAELLQVVIHRESDYWPCAVSAKGAMGLMQLMPATAGELGVRNPFDAEESIAAGARYLSSLLRRFGNNVVLALAAYNAGPTTVGDRQSVPPIPETQNYVNYIMGELRRRLGSGGSPRAPALSPHHPFYFSKAP